MTVIDKFHRQRGIIDQSKLEDLRVFLSGSSDSIAELVVLLRQLGVGEGDGCIGFHNDVTPITTVFWQLMYPESRTLHSASESYRDVFKSLQRGQFDAEHWDIHLDLNNSSPDEQADLYGRVEGPRAFVSTQMIPRVRNFTGIISIYLRVHQNKGFLLFFVLIDFFIDFALPPPIQSFNFRS